MRDSAAIPARANKADPIAVAPLHGDPDRALRALAGPQPDWATREPPGFAAPAQGPGPQPPSMPTREPTADDVAAPCKVFVGMSLARIERLLIEATIAAHGGSLPRAARVLGLSPSTLYRKCARWSDEPANG